VISPEIKNIIFDLGGVILNLSVDATVHRFSALTGLPRESIVENLARLDLFQKHERGAMSDNDFRDGIRTAMNVRCTDEEIDDAWNAMLLDIPYERIELLIHLRKNYRLFLLSNTNGIHLLRFTEILRTLQGNPAFDTLFEKVYYSHHLLMRKPEKEIFEYVLNENDLVARQTLFLDDNPGNLAGAAAVGIHTFHVRQPESLFSLFEFNVQ
jgi:glucose-1-phosphatase